MSGLLFFFFFFFNDTATTEIYTLSLHDALPISASTTKRKANSRDSNATTSWTCPTGSASRSSRSRTVWRSSGYDDGRRSEEHTSELQSLAYLVCRLLLEKKKKHRRTIREALTRV